MIQTKFSGYYPDGTRHLNSGGGGVLASVVNVVLDIYFPPAGLAMHAARGAYDVSQGNYLGAAANAFGAYGAGGGFSEGGFSMPSGEDIAGSFGEMGDKLYDLGGESFSAAELPTGAGTDIAPDITNESVALGQNQVNDLNTTGGLDGSSPYENTGAANNPYDANVPDSFNNVTTQQQPPSLSDTVQNMGASDVGTMDVGGPTLESMDSGYTMPQTNSMGQDAVPEGSYWQGLKDPNYLSNQTGMESKVGLESFGGAGESVGSSGGMGNIWNRVTDNFMKNPIKNTLSAGGTLYGMMQSRDNEAMMRKMAEQSDPFASQRAQYQQMLSQSYQDPMSVYNSPQFRGIDNIFSRQIAARDAAAGRNSQYAARAAERQNNFMQYLDNYRKPLGLYAGANAQPGANDRMLTASILANNNTMRQAGAGLQTLFGD